VLHGVINHLGKFLRQHKDTKWYFSPYDATTREGLMK